MQPKDVCKESIVQVLDCTLRDGGYCNDWNFGRAGIAKILDALHQSKIDIVECGYLSKMTEWSADKTKYTDLSQLNDILPKVDKNRAYVIMINYGEYEIDDLPECGTTPISGIRLAFHKENWVESLKLCEKIQEKGYRVLLQPMVTMRYSEEEFLQMIDCVNHISPYAFCLVDSFGTMRKEDLNYYIELTAKYLKEDIIIGFHAHNNLQLANSNAQMFVEKLVGKKLIVDVSIYGMGRGAGNLNAELFLSYINELCGKKYDIKPLVKITEEVLSKFYDKNPWGYSLINYLAAVHGVHPNYANYLYSMNSLTVDAIDLIFSKIVPEKAVKFDPVYIEDLYMRHIHTTLNESPSS